MATMAPAATTVPSSATSSTSVVISEMRATAPTVQAPTIAVTAVPVRDR